MHAPGGAPMHGYGGPPMYQGAPAAPYVSISGNGTVNQVNFSQCMFCVHEHGVPPTAHIDQRTFAGPNGVPPLIYTSFDKPNRQSYTEFYVPQYVMEAKQRNGELDREKREREKNDEAGGAAREDQAEGEREQEGSRSRKNSFDFMELNSKDLLDMSPQTFKLKAKEDQ